MARPIIGNDPFRAIAHPVRRKILDMLRKQPRAVGDIAGAFRLSLTSVSQHLSVLRDAGLVRHSQKGRHVYYSFDPSPMRKVLRWVESYRHQSKSG